MMTEKDWVVPAPDPDKHIFMKDSSDDVHSPSKDCWCGPILEADPSTPSKDWVWFHRVLN